MLARSEFNPEANVSEWYFAYGSNLCMEQVADRVGPIVEEADRPRVARLPDHRLVFNMQEGPDEIFANIMPGEGTVFGVVYRMTHASLDTMDRHEQGYVRQRVRVVLEDGEFIDAVTYVAEPAFVTAGGRPSTVYLRRIVLGARRHGLPEDYIRGLQDHRGDRDDF